MGARKEDVFSEEQQFQFLWISFNQCLNSRAHVRTLELEQGFLKIWQGKQETMGARKEDVFSEEQQQHFFVLFLLQVVDKTIFDSFANDL
ncbi:hypothetical protein QL285_080489 [Trifolium repens]|nr:hypothetical protein QL285_080489 [Trifolium repens]